MRAGVALEGPSLYLGISFIRFLGGEDQSGRFYTSTLDAEAGYDFLLLHDLSGTGALLASPDGRVEVGVAHRVLLGGARGRQLHDSIEPRSKAQGTPRSQ